MILINKELELIKKEIATGVEDLLENNDIQTFISNGSKFIRSTLAILYLKSNGAEINDSIYKIIASGEIIHSASLLHDDVIDDASERRGKPTFAHQYSPKISILTGDYLLSLAIEKLLDIKNLQILDIFKDCTKTMAKAEIEQFFLRGQLPTIEKYLEICEGKTANLFSVILESCAIISNINTQKAKSLGKLYGLCFQIKNDFETTSAETDKKNQIYTIKDILGIEKSGFLLDNYKRELYTSLSEIPDNEYKKLLEELIAKL